MVRAAKAAAAMALRIWKSFSVECLDDRGSDFQRAPEPAMNSIARSVICAEA
jgi:hypothetical protein